MLVVSIKPFGGKPTTYRITKAGDDKKVVAEAKAALESYDVWCGYYSKGFDIPMLNTRLLWWEIDPIDKRPHIDLYFTLKSNTLTARRSQGHLLAWLGTPEEKMSVSAAVWAQMPGDVGKHMPVMVKRCESDVAGLEALYKRTRHLVRSIKT